MKKFIVLLSLVLLTCTHAAKADAPTPSFDCAKATSDAGKLICSDAELAVLDSELAERFSAALASAKSLDAGSKEAVNTLRAKQRGWIKGRDECWKADDLRTCVEAAYLTRDGELVATWMLEEPTRVESFTCENNPANEVTVFFFDTHLPSIRLEYGDGIRAGLLTPSGSGSKYATAFGGMFWLKGGSAIFSWIEGKDISCAKTE